MEFVWRDYDPETMDFVENWLDDSAVKNTGMDEGFRDFYEYWANEDGNIVGENYWCKVVYEKDVPFAVVAISLWEKEFYLSEIVVAPHMRGQGKGTKLIKELLRNEVILGTPILECQAEIFPENIASQKAFENAGFVYSCTHGDESGKSMTYTYVRGLMLVNYCYPDCIPLMNIMRLPEQEAFALAAAFAEAHPETTAFYRFADFENYYSLRKKQDDYLYARFIELGGMPEEKHPLSFVIEGSDYLLDWFGKGIESRLRLQDISPCHISFTIGDSGAEYGKNGSVKLLTVEDIKELLQKYGNNFDEFLKASGVHYIEAQLWSDKYITMC